MLLGYSATFQGDQQRGILVHLAATDTAAVAERAGRS